jgi:hypothetical protein
MVQRPQCGRLLTSTHTPGQPVRLLGCAMDAEVINFFSASRPVGVVVAAYDAAIDL